MTDPFLVGFIAGFLACPVAVFVVLWVAGVCSVSLSFERE